MGEVAGRGCSTKEKMYYVHCEAHEVRYGPKSNFLLVKFIIWTIYLPKLMIILFGNQMEELEEKFCYCSFNYCNTARENKVKHIEVWCSVFTLRVV